LKRALLSACLPPLILVACDAATPPSQPATSQVLRWPALGVQDLLTLDPALTIDVPSFNAIALVFSGLVDLSQNGTPAPGAASRWEVSADGLVYTFHLRGNLKYSDGTPCVAQDFVDSINRALNPAMGSVVAPTYLGDIAGAQDVLGGKANGVSGLSAPDSSTLVVTLSRPVQYFLAEFTYPTSFAVRKSDYDPKTLKLSTDFPVGTGPFSISSYSHKPGDRLQAQP
jgi:peptide/nickel transport system substrate-binding protein/oligopeptide transport system substrate-binding protein